MPLNPGDILNGHYRIEAEIGRGAYGRVYRARDIKLDRPAAIKELAKGADDLGSSQFADYVRRFEREARVQAGFNHANIVHVYELIQESADRLYLVMEYVDGESLRDALARRGPLPVDEAVRITADILAGLAAVHADPRDIVHRDIKPSNVLLTKTGHAKLADFGLAQVGDESLRSEGGKPHPGTALYMSPEQETTNAYLYPASDLFSVGCVLFEMLAGVPYKRAKKERKGLADLRPDAPPWLNEIVMAALNKDQDDRPANAAEMERLLADGQRIEADKQMAAERARQEAKAKVEDEAAEQTREDARRKAEEDAENVRLAELERQHQEAEEQARQAAERQTQAAALQKAAVEADQRRRAQAAEDARQEAGRKAQAEAEAARLEERRQEHREADEQPQPEAEVHAVARQRALPWAVRGVAVLALLGVIVILGLASAFWHPWTRGAQPEPTSTSAPAMLVGATPSSQPTKMNGAGEASEPTKAPATAQMNPTSAMRVSPTPTALLAPIPIATSTPIQLVPSATRTLQPTAEATSVPPTSTTPPTAKPVTPRSAAFSQRIAQNARIIATYRAPARSLSVAFSPDGQHLAVALWGETGTPAVEVIAIPSGKVVNSVTDQHSTGTEVVAYSPDNRFVAWGRANDFRAILYRISDWQEAAHLDMNKDIGWHVYHLAFSPDGKLLAVQSDDPLIRVWDLATLTEKMQLDHAGSNRWAMNVAFAYNGRYLVTGRDGAVKVWDPTSGRLINTFTATRGSSAASPTEPLIAVATDDSDNTIAIWNLETGQRTAIFGRHSSHVTNMAFDSSGQVLASTFDKTASLWEARNGILLRSLEHPEAIWDIAFSPSGSLIAIAGEKGTIQIWGVD